ncbi:uncharacterized protein LOC128333609 [Hemicordylus capensis]|uniref:uncharacterized protein LOC128333609 n=1 Tax=Hemicordylus capensis TaxID=884348 RepID=UPI002303FB68|nr:uncharacterized protein LOC128333609 [Hemicordylus capensis]
MAGAEEGRPGGRKAITSSSRDVARKLLLPPLVVPGATRSLDDPAPVAGPPTERVRPPKRTKRPPQEAQSTQGEPAREGSPPALPRRIRATRREAKAPGESVPSGEKLLPQLGEGSLPRRRLEAAAAERAKILQPIPRRNLVLGEPGKDFFPLGKGRPSGLSGEMVPPQTSLKNHPRKKALTAMGRPLLKPLPSSWHPPEARQRPDLLPALSIRALRLPKAEPAPSSWGTPPLPSGSVARPPPPRSCPKTRPGGERSPPAPPLGSCLMVRGLRARPDPPVPGSSGGRVPPNTPCALLEGAFH